MKLLSIQIFLLAFVATSFASQSWYYFRTPFNLIPLFGFYKTPRLEADAQDDGWIMVSDGCNGDAKFPGMRYKETEDMFEYNKFLIFDANGYIAGMQSIVPKELTLTQDMYDYEASPWYVLDVIDGQEVYLATAWFVEESVVCTGRSSAEFDDQGTGYILNLQKGETPAEFETAPMSVAEAEGTDWYLHYCFVNMGDHMFQFNYDPNQSCDGGPPFQLLYDHQGDKPLAGFVFLHFLKLEGKGWDSPPPSEESITAIVDTPPTCLLDSIHDPGFATTHVYLLDYIETCLF